MRDLLRRPVELLAAAWLLLVVLAAFLGPTLGASLGLPSATKQAPCTTRQPVRQLDAAGKPVIVGNAYVLVEQRGCSFQEAADDRPAANPSPRHLLGTDQIGRDLLARVIAGARTTLLLAFGSVVAGLVVGVPLGVVAAYAGGRTDAVVTGLCVTILAIPGLILPVAFIAALGRNTGSIWLALSVAAVPIIALLTRAQTRSLVTREFVVAARMIGARHTRVLLREVVPNIAPFALVYFGLGVSAAIAAEGGLAMLGLSVADPATSWGALIGSGRTLISTAPQISLFPTAAMFLTILATTLLCDGVSKRLGLDRAPSL